jgi:hypothetical protein
MHKLQESERHRN